MVNAAMTPEEWQAMVVKRGEYAYAAITSEGLMIVSAAGGPAYHDTAAVLPEVYHSVAALCLHGQPFGFTWEDARKHYVEGVRAEGERHAMMMMTQVRAPDDGFLARLRAVEDRMKWHKSMADRIAALLPPEVP